MIGLPTLDQQFLATFGYGSTPARLPWCFVPGIRNTLDGANISALVDLLDAGHALAQSTSANQGTVETSSNLGGAPCLRTNLTHFYASNQAASRYTAMHDGSPSTLVVVEDMVTRGTTQFFARTAGSTSTTARGITFLRGVSVTQRYTAYTGTGSVAAMPSTNATPASSAANALMLTQDAAGWAMRDNATVRASGAYSNTPSTSAPAATLQAMGTGANGYNGRLYLMAWWPSVLSGASLAIVAQWIRSKTGAVL